MAFEVNLVSKQIKKIGKNNKTVSYLKLAAEGILLVFVVALFGFFGFLFYRNNQVVEKTNKAQALLQEVSEKADTEFRYRYLLGVLDEAEEIMETRKDFQGILQEVYSLVPPIAVIDRVSFVDDVVVLTVLVGGVQSASLVIDNMEKIAESNELFDRVSMTSMKRSSEGIYTIDLQLGLKKT